MIMIYLLVHPADPQLENNQYKKIVSICSRPPHRLYIFKLKIDDKLI